MSHQPTSERLRPTARLTLPVAIAVLAVPTVFTAACSDESVKPEGDPLSADQQTELGDRIASAMTDAGSVREESTMDVSVEADGQSVAMTMYADGVSETTDSPMTQFDLNLHITGAVTESVGPVTALSDGDQVFVRSSDVSDIDAFTGSSSYSTVDPNRWVRLSSTEAEAIANSTSYADYPKLIESIEGADAGEDEIGHRYNLVGTPEEFMDSGLELNSVGEESMATLPEDVREDMLDTPMKLSLWLDPDDRVVQQTIDMNVDTDDVTVDVSATIKLSEFGVEVPQETPRQFQTF